MQVLCVLWCFEMLSHGSDEAGDGDAVLACGFGKRRWVNLNFHRRAVEEGGRRGGNDAERALHLGERPFHNHHCAHFGAVCKKTSNIASGEELCVKR